MVEPAHRSRQRTAVRSPAWTSVGFVRPHSAAGRPEGQRGRDRSRLAHPKGDDQPRAGGQPRHDEDRHPRVEPVGEHPDEDRTDREPEVAPEAVDPGDRPALSRFGDVGDDGEQCRVDHRGSDTQGDPRRQPRPEPGRCRHRGDRQPPGAASRPRSGASDRPRPTARRSRSGRRPMSPGRPPPGARSAPRSRPADNQTIGSSPHTRPSLRLLTRPACDAADSDRSAIVLRQASPSQPGVASGGAAPHGSPRWHGHGSPGRRAPTRRVPARRSRSRGRTARDEDRPTRRSRP